MIYGICDSTIVTSRLVRGHSRQTRQGSFQEGTRKENYCDTKQGNIKRRKPSVKINDEIYYNNL